MLRDPARETAEPKRLYALTVENIEHNLELVKDGFSFEAFSKGCWPYPKRSSNTASRSLAHGIGVGDEWPAMPSVDWGEQRENVVVCIGSFIGSEHGGDGCELPSAFPRDWDLPGE